MSTKSFGNIRMNFGASYGVAAASWVVLSGCSEAWRLFPQLTTLDLGFLPSLTMFDLVFPRCLMSFR